MEHRSIASLPSIAIEYRDGSEWIRPAELVTKRDRIPNEHLTEMMARSLAWDLGWNLAGPCSWRAVETDGSIVFSVDYAKAAKYSDELHDLPPQPRADFQAGVVAGLEAAGATYGVLEGVWVTVDNGLDSVLAAGWAAIEPIGDNGVGRVLAVCETREQAEAEIQNVMAVLGHAAARAASYD
ncbi:MAG: hypothetical protein AAGE52_01385 [Myxococcota bacterium]